MKISNSQMQTLQTCERKFLYSHVWDLRPPHLPEPMERGLDGHELLETAFKAMLAGATALEAIKAMDDVLIRIADTNIHSLKIYRHVVALVEHVASEQWVPIHIEQNFSIEMENDNRFVFTPDAIFQFTSGPNRGSYFIVDYKFTGQYWSEAELATFQQLPKYKIYAEKALGIKIRHLGLIMLNTRAAESAQGSQLFQVKWLTLTRQKLERIEKENEVLLQRTAEAKEKFTDRPELALRTVNTFACKLCWFADVCSGELEGRDITKMLNKNYVKNTYFEDNYGSENA